MSDLIFVKKKKKKSFNLSAIIDEASETNFEKTTYSHYDASIKRHERY